MSDRSLDDLDPRLKNLCQQWLDACKAAGLKVLITETFRSSQDQDADYAIGRTEPGRIITNAKGGESPHNCTLEDGTPASRAFDFAIHGPKGLDWNAQDSDWRTAISIGEGLDLESGTSFRLKDYAHFQLKNWNNDYYS